MRRARLSLAAFNANSLLKIMQSPKQPDERLKGA